MGKKTAKKSTSFLGTSALTRPLFALGAASVLFGAGQAQALDSGALPQNPNVVGGKDSFSQSGNTLNINQKTNRTVIDWRSFDIGSKAQVNFNQPGSSSIAVNRVNGSTNPSDIEGGLHANGQVWILNPNGVFFGKGARVDAAGIVATTANINDKAFMAGSNKLRMKGADHGFVENQGRISVGANGLAAFVAPSVRNSGVINARVGRVTLAAGTTYTLDLAGDHMVELGLGSVNAVVDNSGKIVNPGGTIALTAKAAGQVVNSVVNVSGVVSASSVTKSGGTIVLGADTVNTTQTAQVTADAGTNGTGGTITSVANKQGNYAGTFSAKGGSKAGDGGKIETSGHDVAFGNGLAVSASASKGKAGEWTVDPTEITIDGALASTIDATLLGGTSFTVSTSEGAGDGDITLASSINTATTNGADLTITGRHLFATGGSTVSLNGAGSALTLNVNAIDNTANPGSTWISDALGMIGTVTDGTTINLGAGTYAAGTSINKANVTLNGGHVATISVPVAADINGINVDANNVTVEGLEIIGPATSSFQTYAWSGTTRGIAVHNGFTGFNITDNNIHDVRNGILIDGRNTGSITNNIIDNTKSAISVQYTDAGVGNSEGYSVTITGNDDSTFGNEWGINTHLNGHYVGTPTNLVGNAVKIATDAPTNIQQALLAFKAANNGMTAQDQGYAQSNRTDVNVSTTGSDANQGSVLSALGTIQGGINAVVTGGVVNVGAGSFGAPSGTYIEINKALTLNGAGVGVTTINGASTYGIRVQADDVSLNNFSLVGSSSGYGIKVEPLGNGPADPTLRVNDFQISNVAISGSKKTGLDLNSVNGGTIDNVSVSGVTNGNGIALTDSQNITLTDVTTTGNAWGGLALYQTNRSYDGQLTNINVDASNTFNEANGIYIEDESDGIADPDHGASVANWNPGTLNIAGYNYVAADMSNSADQYTFFQKTKTDALNFATNATLNGAHLSLGGVYVEGWTGSAVNNLFTVGTTNGHAMSIQAAVNAAAAGAEIDVLAGNYQGQVVINKSLTLEGAGQGSTTISAPDTLSHSFTAGGNPYKAVISIEGGANVSVSALTVDGRGVGDANNRLLGIGIYNSDATIDGVTVTRVRSGGIAGSLNGVQAGTGIEAYNDSGFHTVTVKNSTITDFQKNGIAFVGKGITAVATNNTITGAGSTGAIAQNGIEIWGTLGSITGTITGNTISGINYTGNDNAATDIILINANGTTVSGNTITGTGAGDSSNGIYVSGSTGVNLTANTITKTGFGIDVDNGFGVANVTIQNNFVNNNGVGVQVGYDETDTSVVNATNNDFSGNTNAVELESSSDTANFSGNWWGSTNANTISAMMTGADANLVDFSPFLMSGTDSNRVDGFQGDFSHLAVTALGGGDAARIQEGINDVTAGGTVNVTAGNYTLAGELDITKSLSLIGAGVGVTNITSTSTGYGIAVDADNVTLSSFIFNASSTGTYGIKVYPDTGVSSDRLHNFAIDHVAINGSKKTGLDLNGVVNATIDHVTVSNTTNGNGIALTDSSNVTLTNVTTTNNAWGGLALYQTNRTYDQQLGNITVDGTNTFNEANGVYAEDESASLDMGSLTLAGYNYAAIDKSNAADQYTFFQHSKADAVAFATNGTLNSHHLSLANTYIEGWNGTGLNNVFTVGTGVDGAMSIATANNAAGNGATINVLAGDYTLTGELDITKSLTLNGAGATTNITSLSTGYGINVTADTVSLKNFTYHGPTASGSTYGIKVTPDTNAASDRLRNFDIENVTILGGYRTGLDLNGVVNATINNVSVSNIVHGNGIALTDSANVTLTNVTTTNNAWGGLALYQTNAFYNQQLNNISVDGTNTFNEANGVYEEDQSASLDMGSLTLAGYNYAAIDKSVSNDQYTFFQHSKADALNFATNATLNSGHLNAANTYVEGWNGTGLNNVFEVGAGLAIQSAENAAAANGTINVASGTYAENVAVGTQLTFNFGDVNVTSFTLNSGAAGSTLNGDLTATGAIRSTGAVNLAGDFTAGFISLGATTLSGDTTLDTSAANGNITVASVTGGGNDLSIDAGTGPTQLGNVANAGALLVDGAVQLTGTSYAANSASFGAVSLTGNTTVAANAITVASVTGVGNSLTLDGATSLGNVAGVNTLAVTGASTLTGTSYAAASMGFGGAVTLTGDTTLDASGAVTLASVNGGGNDLTIDAGTTALGNVANTGALAIDGVATLTGTSYVADSMAFDAVTLANSVALNTSADNGAIVLASVDGSSAGGQSLTINAGKGKVSLGNVGATTRLGAVSDSSATTLTGSAYNANSLLFGGDVTLTKATTTLNTTQSSSAAGDITFQGDIFGTTDGGQSLTLIAGSGKGAASANGDITLQNAGTEALKLGDMTVSGNDFTALTVWLAGGYTSTLTGNQVFAADTLHTGGDVNSTVGGDASGHIVSSGDVNIAATGDVSGTISGDNVTLSGDNVNSTVTANSATVTGNTVQGSYTADNVSLTATNNVNAAVDATDFTLSAPHGSVDGTWTNLDASGSGIVDVNGQPVVGQANFNPNQLVVEGFVLPAGTIITATGELILPQGTLLGLLSPGGGKPKMILVHTVQQLGELLAGGYSVIVIDLSGKEKGKLVQLASN